jgi:small subunit ribosomal protein S4
VRPGDVVQVRERSRKLPPITNAREMVAGRTVPDWLTLDDAALKGTVIRLPERAEMEQTIDEQLVVEFYSR